MRVCDVRNVARKGRYKYSTFALCAESADLVLSVAHFTVFVSAVAASANVAAAHTEPLRQGCC